jgi:hypothetical protein
MAADPPGPCRSPMGCPACSTDSAERFGLANRVVDDEDLASAGHELNDRLEAQPSMQPDRLWGIRVRFAREEQQRAATWKNPPQPRERAVHSASGGLG